MYFISPGTYLRSFPLNIFFFLHYRYFQWLFGQINNVIDDDNNKVKLLFMDSLLEVELNNIRNFSK
jgi:hypothetical protein